jgi:hypothetical protein
MMSSLVLFAALLLVAVAAAAVIRRRRGTEAPSQRAWSTPAQLDRADFGSPRPRWLVAVFTSGTCHSCASMVAKADVLTSEHVAVVEVEVGAQPALHRRYKIDAVPITVVADEQGVVRAAFVGPTSATDLWAAVAEVRTPGSSPEPHLGQTEA